MSPRDGYFLTLFMMMMMMIASSSSLNHCPARHTSLLKSSPSFLMLVSNFQCRCNCFTCLILPHHLLNRLVLGLWQISVTFFSFCSVSNIKVLATALSYFSPSYYVYFSSFSFLFAVLFIHLGISFVTGTPPESFRIFISASSEVLLLIICRKFICPWNLTLFHCSLVSV